MAIMKGCSAYGYKAGFVFPAEAKMELEDCSTTNCEVGFFAYNSSADIESMMRSLCDHQREFDELKKSIENLPEKNSESVKAIIKASSLAALLSASADATTVMDFILQQLHSANII